MDVLVLNTEIVSLLTCTKVDDMLCKIIKIKNERFHQMHKEKFIGFNQFKPTYHYRQELIYQLHQERNPVVNTSTYIGEKINHYLKHLLSRYVNINWSFRTASKRRYILQQRNRYHFSKQKWCNMRISKYYDSVIRYWIDQDETSILNETVRLSIGDFILCTNSRKIGKIIDINKESTYLEFEVQIYEEKDEQFYKCFRVMEKEIRSKIIFNLSVPVKVVELDSKIWCNPFYN